MAKREFLMLAHTYNVNTCWVTRSFMSRKLDGERCFWDGGITRGIPKKDVPWAYTEKDGRFVEEQISTGLWTRAGNVRHAPDWWLDSLPPLPLDGELYSEVMSRQELFSILRRNIENVGNWSDITLNVFDTPSFDAIFKSGVVSFGAKKEKFFDRQIIKPFVEKHSGASWESFCHKMEFDYVVPYLRNRLVVGQAILHPQEQLPSDFYEAIDRMDKFVEEVVKNGGEGAILRGLKSIWRPERSWSMLKVKPADDAEAYIIGYTTGRETDLGSKLLGKIGALILKTEDGIIFKISGLTDAERVFDSGIMTEWAELNPEEECPEWITSKQFPRGSRVTFTYRGKSDGGVPIEARYLRPRPEGE